MKVKIKKIMQGKIDIKKLKSKKFIPIVLLVFAFAIGGTMIMLHGSDAVTVASDEKNSILAADNINASFQGVSGRIVSVEVSEQEEVEAGDIIMSLDTMESLAFNARIFILFGLVLILITAILILRYYYIFVSKNNIGI